MSVLHSTAIFPDLRTANGKTAAIFMQALL